MEEHSTESVLKRKRKNLILIGLCFLAGFFLGYYANLYKEQKAGETATFQEIRRGGYKFINPLVECEGPQRKSGELKLDNLINNINKIIKNRIQEGLAIDISIYFRDLNNGPWFGIKEKEEFLPASLLKVPLMLAYFKEAEKDPALLSKIILYEKPTITETEMIPYFKSSKSLEEGETYSVDELIYRMIVYSDNAAKDLLLYNISDELILKLERELNMAAPHFNKPEPYVSLKSYCSVFRILFNASYLNPEMSEKALSILAKSEFNLGLVAGMHGEVPVAHKFGERGRGNILQLHDCGIVYFPGRPYLLGIMTIGTDYESLLKLIREISGAIYSEIKKSQQ